jgi:protein CpxP
MKMKNLLILMLAMISFASHAQQDKNERDHNKKEMRQNSNKLSPEQMAELSSKKMTLYLDLNEVQQKKLYTVALGHTKLRHARFQNKKDKTELNDEEHFKLKMARLDNQIAFRKEMKSILTDKQYRIWQESGHFRKNKNQREQKRRNACSEKR